MQTLTRQWRFWVETKGLSLEQIDELFEGKKTEHVHLGTDTTIGRIDAEKGDKNVDDGVTVLETKDTRT